MGKIFICFAALLSFIGTSFCEPAYNSITSKGITFKWMVDGENLKVILDSPFSGWVAVGFGASFMMKKANIIIGYVDKGEVFISDDFGTGFTSHKPDEELGGTYDVKEKSGTETEGKTEIFFTIPLKSNDKYDKLLIPGKTYKIILAAGDAHDFITKHKITTSAKIKL